MTDSVPAPASAQTGRLGDRFVQAGLLTQAQVEQIVARQRETGARFGEVAVALGMLTDAQVMEVLSAQFNYATATGGGLHLSQELAIAHRPFGAEAENIRQLRTALAMRLPSMEAPASTLALVSPTRENGKRYLAASLAIAFAQSGRDTLLVDADLRKETDDHLFGLAKPPGTSSSAQDHGGRIGLSTLLAGRAPMDQAILQSGFPKLDVLTAGPRPPNPLELLVEPRLQDMLAQARPRYNLILIITPAAQVSADAYVIARQVDSCILVARKDVTRLRTLRDTEKQLVASGAHLIGSAYAARADTGRRPWWAPWRRVQA